VEASSYPVGHSSHPQEMTAMADFLDKILYGEDE
jgi:predicted esterase